MKFFLNVLMVILVNILTTLVPKNQGIAQTIPGIADNILVGQIIPKSYQDYFNRGNLYFRQGDFEKALRDYTQAIFINPNHYGLYFNRALTHQNLGDYEGALEDLNQAIALRPTLTAYLQRGYIYGELGDIPLAIADFQHTADLAKEIGNSNILRLAQEAIQNYRDLHGI